MSFTVAEISNCGRKLFVTDLVFIAICLIFLLLRFWSACYARRRIYADDIFVVLSFANVVALASVASWAVFSGLGKHIWELSPSQLVIQIKLLLISELTYLMATAFVKFSVLWLYNRIYTTPVFRRWCYGLMAFDIAYMISFLPLYLTNCVPLSQLWHPVPGGWCRDPAIGDNATIAVNLILDVAILVLPMPVLWRLQMSVRDKITITAMFSIGIVTIGVMVWRLIVTLRTRSSPDWTETLCRVGLISSLEVYLGIIAACIPTLGPLFNACVKHILNRLGIVKTALSSPKMGPKGIGPETIADSNSNGRPRRPRPYSELYDSQDQIIARDGSMALTPTVEGKVTAECTFEPISEARRSSHVQGAIHVQRDIEAIYKWKNGEAP
ncbi:hypothetical protein HD806DRAFT_520044 [Xylariaceae sp. AK1471]|nr:hypothetical protein HD806DRAFT_520044 [Xylariaceae sp. AK1471]